MIYITGDCHGDYRRFGMEIFPEQREMTKEDYVVVCGDFGFWDRSKEQRYWMKWLEAKPFTTLWVDGNHENFDLLSEYPVESWHGGKVHKINSSVIHLMRGQVFELNGKTFFTFGGASSHDISAGVLDRSAADFKSRKKELDRMKAPYRILHESWWPQEMPEEWEKEEGRRNLEKRNWTVDFIVTHCCATSTREIFSGGPCECDELNEYLEEIRRKCSYCKWFFGHHHRNLNVTDKEIMLYEQILRIQ